MASFATAIAESVRERLDHLRQLQADEHEKDAVENEGDHLPNRHDLKSRPPAQDAGHAPPVKDAGNHNREDAGDMKHFPAEIGDVGSKQGEHGLHRRIVQTLLHLRRQPARRETDPDATRGDEKKLQLASPSEKVPVSTAATAKRKEMKEVASFTRLSPSRMTTILRGTFRFCVTASAATASGGEMRAPKTKPTAKGNPVRA